MKIFYSVLIVHLMVGQIFGQSKLIPKSFIPPVNLTNEEDHSRLLKLLNINSLRPGPSGNPNAPNAANSDESKANPYPNLPDPLKLNNGDLVTSSEMWWKKRRPEIKEYFDREIYGRLPENIPSVKWDVIKVENNKVADIPVITKNIIGHVDNTEYPLINVDIELTLVLPSDRKSPAPVIVHFGFDFSKFPNFDLTKLPPDFDKWKSEILSHGYGYAILIPTGYQDDNGSGLTNGIIGLVNKGQPRKVDDWGALRAWAWGASKSLDYLKTDADVDGNKVGIEGLSRYGKAALVTMAYDQRFAIGFIGSSGEGGASLLRRNFGELIENVASSGEYHWMAGNFLKYAGPQTAKDLPIDAHELISMCAPRPLFIGCGSPEVEGIWIDAKGQFMATVAAGPVYKLLGKKDMGVAEMPEVGTALIDGDIAFRQHFGGHTNSPNWETFLKFADKYFNE
ncbi:MAG: hypothetical protein OQJ81_04655 [Melioribacteraceae bacterium]|nr:hypothetical protein [Melioribacteraceae bacterium]